jgi:hypothetical protein
MSMLRSKYKGDLVVYVISFINIITKLEHEGEILGKCEVYIPQLLVQCNNTSLLINYCYIYINKMRTVFVIQIVQLVMRTNIQYTYT